MHLFNIDLIPVELGSFDVIIDMDWLSKYHAMIVCDEKIVRIPRDNEIFKIQGDRNDGRSESRLNSEEKRLEDVPIVRDYPEVFPVDLPRVLLIRQVEISNRLSTLCCTSNTITYRLASSKMQELSSQLQELANKGFIRPSSLP
ncbi:hypothetical protein Tco_0390340 [Tanacetum coccineum]